MTMLKKEWLIFIVSLLLILQIVNVNSFAISSNPTISTSKPKAIATAFTSSKFDANLKQQAFIQSLVPKTPLEHTGDEKFDAHLYGVAKVLNYWSTPIFLQTAGLFHSVYSTQGFTIKDCSVSFSERGVIQNLISAESEELVFAFCAVDRYTVDSSAIKFTKEGFNLCSSMNDVILKSRPELGSFPIQLKFKTFVDLVILSLGDWLEQVEGSSFKSYDLMRWRKPGDSWAYRRLGYNAMNKFIEKIENRRLILKSNDKELDNYSSLNTVTPGIISKTYQAVYGMEDEKTRGLVQIRTPPTSVPASDAYDAMCSNGSLGFDIACWDVRKLGADFEESFK